MANDRLSYNELQIISPEVYDPRIFWVHEGIYDGNEEFSRRMLGERFYGTWHDQPATFIFANLQDSLACFKGEYGYLNPLENGVSMYADNTRKFKVPNVEFLFDMPYRQARYAALFKLIGDDMEIEYPSLDKTEEVNLTGYLNSDGEVVQWTTP